MNVLATILLQKFIDSGKYFILKIVITYET